MPDVTRSDSQRSDASHKPRVSFNRDVHVKRIGREGVVSALAGDGEGHLVPLAVRRERPGRLSRRELEQEAEEVLRQADRVRCTPDKYSTLPTRTKAGRAGHSPISSIFNSLDRRGKKQKHDGSRRYSTPDTGAAPPARPLHRSVSDAGHRHPSAPRERSLFGTLGRKKPPSLSDTPRRDEVVAPARKKKQLSPIIESSPSPRVEGGPWFAPAPSPRPSPQPEPVVYAEVVSRPRGKTTVHRTVTATAPQPAHRTYESEEDEGVDMGHRGAQYDNDVTIDIRREMDSTPRRKDDEIRGEQIINMLRSRSNPLLDEDLVGGYRREVRTERVIRVHGGEDEPDGRGRADGTDYSSRRRMSRDLMEEELVNKTQSYDNLDRIRYQEPIRAWTPTLETSLIDSNNLSYRRDRLESRLTNHKRRFPSTAHENSSYRDNKLKGDDLRKDFLKSQIDDKERGYFEKKIVTEIDTHHRQQLLKNKDVLADSGIEMSDYRKDSGNDVATMNRRNAGVTRITRTETSRTRSSHSPKKTDYNSDSEKIYKTDPSSRFIEEERRKKDIVPASSTLVKSYSKPTSREEQKTITKKEEKITKEKKKDKLTRMDRVKQLMFGSKEGKKNKKKKKKEEEEEDLLRSRYTEYKGSDVSANSSPVIHRHRQTSSSEMDDRTDQEFYGSRQRLATPTPSEHKGDDTWLKSLTRRNKHAKVERRAKATNGYGEDSLRSNNKHLRFFGDSDRESLRSAQIPHHRDSSPNPNLLQVPHGRSRVLAPDSSAESTTEGDSSQHSQKSVVYLHAATVGDIPGSRKLQRSVISAGRRSMSREELSSHSEVITPQSRTLSRSISVLAPWRPKHNRQEINYDGGGKPPRVPKVKKPVEGKPEHREKTEKHKKNLRKSKENLIDYQDESRRGSKESVRGNGNLVFVGKRESYDSQTIDRARHRHRSDKARDLSRSTSIPKDSCVSSGWFKGKSPK